MNVRMVIVLMMMVIVSDYGILMFFIMKVSMNGVVDEIISWIVSNCFCCLL